MGCGWGNLSMNSIFNNSVVFNYSGVCPLFLILLSKKSTVILIVGHDMASRDRLITDQWALMKDIVGSASLWPRAIRRPFWTRNLLHFQDFLVVCFCYVNGLSPAEFWDWANLLQHYYITVHMLKLHK